MFVARYFFVFLVSRSCPIPHDEYNCFVFFICRDVSTKKHLKNVYGALSVSMMAAGIGAGFHLYSGINLVNITFTFVITAGI